MPSPVLLAILGVAVGAGCGSQANDSGWSLDEGGAPVSDGGSGPGVGEAGMFNFDAGTSGGLVIAPANATLDVDDLSSLPTLQFHALTSGGAMAPQPRWYVSNTDVGVVNSSGLVQAAGLAFGQVTVGAQAGARTGTTTLTVRLHTTVNAGSLAPGQQSQLDGASQPDPGVTALAYPYDHTVLPRGLLPPEIMWNGGSPGDLYSVHFVATDFDLTVYAAADPPSRFTPDTSLWNALTATAAHGDVSVKLNRLSSGQAWASASETWHVADANLRGTIYYWSILQGQIVKLDLSTGQRNAVFDPGTPNVLGSPAPLNSSNPLSPPWDPNTGGQRCIACHAVSKDGSTLASVFSRRTSTGPVGFVNLATSQPTAIGDYKDSSVWVALSPDGKVAADNDGNKTMHLLDATTGAAITSLLDGMANVCDPTFSPDGKTFAFASQCDPGYGYPVEYRTANLSLADFDPASRSLANVRTVQQSSGLGDAIAFPSFSPDSKWIFYQRGDYARAKYSTAGSPNAHGNDDLFVAGTQAGAAQIALANANGTGTLPSDNLHLNYAPTVNPIAEGGYIWVVFTSPRDFGNRMVSPGGAPPADATYSNHKQLWVAAVDANIGTTDPSHPAFWLPGQDQTTTNMFGYWALAPCKPTQGASSCTAGYECCSGYCRDTGSGPTCVAPPSGCSQVGEKCSTRSDCCNAGPDIQCAAGVCQETHPQ